MGAKRVVQVATLAVAVCSALVLIPRFNTPESGVGSASLSTETSLSADQCELEVERQRRGVLSLHLASLDDEKWMATLEIKSDNAFDSFWYLASSDPPLQDYTLPQVFTVRGEPLKLRTTVSRPPAALRLGKQFRSYAYLKEDQSISGVPVIGRYPLAQDSVVIQVSGDDVKRGTHLTAEGTGHAVDLRAAPGTEVVAFASGVLVLVEDGYDDELRCGEKHANTYGNVLAILQDDGYEAIYGHLQMGSSLVAEGMRVEPGQPIARVGRYNGEESKAHLHFQLGGMTERGLVSTPVAFELYEGGPAIIPKVGQAIRPR